MKPVDLDPGVESDETGVDRRNAVDRWVMPYITDSTLWPVLLVIMAHVVAFVAPVLLFAVRDRHYVAIATALGLAPPHRSDGA